MSPDTCPETAYADGIRSALLELLFLGTAASEGYPDAFCACPNCEQARALGGRSLRKRSAALIDDILLCDLGPDLMAAAIAHGVSLTGVRWCIQTHEHQDHLDPSHLLSRSPLCGVPDAPLLTWYASHGALCRAAEVLGDHVPEDGLLDPEIGDRLNLRVCPIDPGESFLAGPYRVTAVPAAHGRGISPLLYVIERNGRAIFYGTDTGPLPELAWEVLRGWSGALDLVILDHTFGLEDRATGHMNADQFREQIVRMRDERLLSPKCRVIAHHLGHHSNPDHETLQAMATEWGYEVAYDGMRVTV